MDKRRLGRSKIAVSPICLGTMTWGEQNNQDEAFQQMDYALDQGIDFFDTAEMYPIAPRKETHGRTEEIIGNWISSRSGAREKIVLATKVLGPSQHFTYVRDGKPRLNAKHIPAALDASLKRLKTDYVDLYQLHWPDRSTNTFGKLGFAPSAEEEMTSIEETLEVLSRLVEAGKLREVGLSNETPWGTMRFLAHADGGGGPRAVSIQNPYSLLNRSYEVGMAEVSIREDCGLLAYAPLGAGTLTGKYLGGAQPPGARLTLFPQNTRYRGPRAEAAIADYVALAAKHGLDPAQMAIAFCLSRPFMTSVIIGATSMEQLKTNIAAREIKLSEDLLGELEVLHKVHTIPCP